MNMKIYMGRVQQESKRTIVASGPCQDRLRSLCQLGWLVRTTVLPSLLISYHLKFHTSIFLLSLSSVDLPWIQLDVLWPFECIWIIVARWSLTVSSRQRSQRKSTSQESYELIDRQISLPPSSLPSLPSLLSFLLIEEILIHSAQVYHQELLW